MLKHILKYSNRTLIVTFEMLAVVALLLALFFGLFVWKVSQGPISIGWAKDYVEEALSSAEDEFSVEFDDMVFSWPELRGPFLLDLTGLKVSKGEGDANSLSIDSASVGLSRRALLYGRIRPVSVIIRQPSIELVRGRDGKLSLFLDGHTQEVKAADEAQPKENDPGREVAEVFRDMATHKRGSLIGRLNEFHIMNASVAIRDYDLGLSWYLSDFDFLIREEEQGVVASLKAQLPSGREGAAAGLSMDMAYRKETDDFRAIGKITELNPYAISKFLPVPETLSGQDLFFSGDIDAAMDANLMPTYFKLNGSIPEGQISIPEEYDAPITVKNIVIESEYSKADKLLKVPVLNGEIGGIPFTGKAAAAFGTNAVVMPIKMNVAGAQLAQIPPLFPKSEHDGEAYEWLGRNIEGGTFSDVALDMELSAQRVTDAETQVEDWDVQMPRFKLDFAFEDAKVTYNDTLMPAENGKGKGHLDLVAETLEITDASATIGDIQGTDVTVKLIDMMKKGAGYLTVAVRAKGPVATALSYIAAEPINMGEAQIGLNPKTVKGTIDAQVDIGLPTIKDMPKDEVEVGIDGTLSDLDIPNIVQGLPLSGGPLHLKTEPGGFRIDGPAKLAGREVDMAWHQYFESKGNPYSMQVKAKIGADHELRDHFGVNLDEYISGTMPVDVVFTDKGDGTATVDVKGDLTPVRLYIDAFKFEKPVGTAGTISTTAHLKDDILKKLSAIELNAKDISVSGATINFAPMNGKKADIDSGSLPNAKIGKTQASVTFDTDSSGALRVNAKAPVFDLEPILSEGEASDISMPSPEKKNVRPMKISLDAVTMLAKNEQKVTPAKAYLEFDDEGDITQIEFDGKVGKKQGDINVRFKPDASGKRTFRLDTNDAGATLYTFGVYNNVHGGVLRIYGEPKDNNPRGDLHGSMQMENFRVVKAPALASLLSLMSLTGVTQIHGNEGIVFSKLESGFEWRFRPEGNILIIKDGTTSGSSIGLTFAGVLDRGKKTTDIAGTIIPMTELNSILSKIPLVGELLGGATGLIAATYSMKGPTSDPKVSVNPLSVLAPGIIRRVLFEGGYESKIPDRAPAPPKAEAAPVPSKGIVTAPNGATKPATSMKTHPAAKAAASN